jgi:hypothetical protein
MLRAVLKRPLPTSNARENLPRNMPLYRRPSRMRFTVRPAAGCDAFLESLPTECRLRQSPTNRSDFHITPSRRFNLLTGPIDLQNWGSEGCVDPTIGLI